MPAAEQLRENNTSEALDETGNPRIDWIRKKLAENVRIALDARQFNDTDAREYLSWIGSEHDVKKLQEAHLNFKKTVEFLEGEHAKYEKDLIDAANDSDGSLFAKKSIPKYMEWFKGLTDKQKVEYNRDKSTALHDPRRKVLRDIMKGKGPIVLGTKVRLPQAIRNQYWKEFENSDLQEREVLVARLIQEHLRLKNAFLEFPAEIQKKYAEEFSKANMDQRKQLLGRIQQETGQKVLRKKEAPENEAARLDSVYFAKIKNMVDDELLAEGSAEAYRLWFKGLRLKDKQIMLNHSELDTRMDPETGKINLRLWIRNKFYALPPEVQARHRERFMQVDVDRRLQMIESLENPEKAAHKNDQTIEYSEEEITAAIETAKQDPSVQESLLIMNLVDLKFEQHKRAREKLGIGDTLKSEAVMQKAEEKGWKKRNKDASITKTLTQSDKRVSSKNNMQAFLAVERMKAERQKMAKEYEKEDRTKEIEHAQGEELVEDLKQVGTMDEQTENFAQETRFENVHVKTLSLRRDARNAVRKDAINHEETWQNHNARRADIRFYNAAGDKELSEHDFDAQVRQHQKAETRAKLLPLVQHNLPGASTTVLEKALEQADKKEQLRMDFRKVIA